MNRRRFLQTLAALTLCRETRSSASDPPVEKFILGVPLTHSDWVLKAGVEWGPAGVRHMLDACKACGWSRVYWRALDGGRALYYSRLLCPQGPWDEDSFWSPKTPEDTKLVDRFTNGMAPSARDEIRKKLASLDYAHFDSLAVAAEYAHRIGLQLHAWVSVNEDDHGWGIQSEFSKRHPESRWVRRDGRAYHSQLSFAFPEVRQYKLSILKELLEGYAIDGLFLDWIRTGDVRDNPQTDAAGVADSGYERPLIESFRGTYGIDPHTLDNGDDRWVRARALPQTLFMRDVRRLVTSRPKKLPIAVVVAHPWHYRGAGDKIDGNLRGLLLDVGRWSAEGLIDAAVAAGYYRDGGTPGRAAAALRAETGNTVDVWSYAWVPRQPADFEKDCADAASAGAGQILLWEADYIGDRPNAPALKAAMSARAKW